MSLEEQLARLGEIERAEWTDDTRRELCDALANASNIVIERAAQIMGDSGEAAFIPPLTDAFQRVIRQPATADKNCRAKEAIVTALDALDSEDPAVSLLGIRHVQMEPVFGGRADTAPNLRGQCANALARMRYAEVHFVITNLLVDPELPARLAAVQALGYLGDERSELLLRLKVLTGDEEPEVLGRAFTGLLVMAPERSLPFVAGFLSSTKAGLAEQAAVALGESREKGAFGLLRDYWEANSDLDFRKVLLLAIALTRCDEAFAFLLTVIRDEGRSSALQAVNVMTMFAPDEKRREKIIAAAREGGDGKVIAAAKQEFGSHD